MKRFPIWQPVAAVLLWSSLVHAGSGPEDKELAKKLYQQAAEDMERGAYDRACPQFEAALKIDSQHIRTAITLGTCEDRWGKLVGAWHRFQFARRLAIAQSATEKLVEIDQHLADLNRRLPKLRIIVPANLAGSNGLIVVCNGTQVQPSDFGKALPVDPGSYQIGASASGLDAWNANVQTKLGQTIEVTVGATGTTYQTNAAAEESPLTSGSSSYANGSVARPVGFTGIGLGAAGIVVGSILGGLAISKNSASDDGHCDVDNYCNTTGTALRLDAQGYANASTALFAVGGAFLIGGIVLVATAPSPAKRNQATVTTSVWIGLGGVGVRGRW